MSSPDYVKTIIDKGEFPIILLSVQNIMLIQLQVNIESSTLPPESPEFSHLKFYNPTPCQYAVMINKSNLLESLLNFMCNQKEDYHINTFRQYQNGLKLDISSVYCPTVSNSQWPLLQLSVAYSSLESLVVLINFLKEQNCLNDYINLPDYRKRTPLSVAFITGNEEIIKLLFKSGADPFYGVDNEDAIIPFINTIINYKHHVPRTIEYIKEIMNDDGFNPFILINLFYFRKDGVAYSNQVEDSVSLEEFLRDYPEAHALYESQVFD